MGALFASWPAFYYVLANTFCLPGLDVGTWVAIGLVLLLCVAAGISYTAMAKLCATTGIGGRRGT